MTWANQCWRSCLALVAFLFTNNVVDATNYFCGGRILIVSSSHQDTAWMDSPAFCRRYRVEHVILPALELMRTNPNYTFSMENALHLEELLDAHPELRSEVIQRVRTGRLTFGALYNEPYESWLSGEELVRETYFGRRWVLKNLPGCDATVYFNPDPPGRAWQMQQILAKAGIPCMFISRFHEGLWRWQSPDGSSVLAYSPGHYGNDMAYLDGPPPTCLQVIRKQLEKQSPLYEEHHIPPVFCLFNSTDFSRPVDFDPLLSAWNGQSPAQFGDCAPPTMSYSTMSPFFAAVDQPQAKFRSLLGERPDVWAYITGPTHHDLATAKRETARLLPAAEIFTSIASLLAGNFSNWPSNALNQAWKDELYIDHGIGGKNGHITDEVFFSKIRKARDTGRTLLTQALGAIAARVKTDASRGTPVVVFNDLLWARSDVVEVDLPESVAWPVRVVNADGSETPSQETRIDSPDEINVAAANLGASATADSEFSPDYAAEKAIDGRWNVRDPNPETGNSAKWNSDNSSGAHWLVVDFGRARTVHKIVIRHEGVLGVFGGETQYNTVDFRLQSAEASAGPWIDLVAPVTNNSNSLTVHRFAPKSFRFLRLYITKGAQHDSYARIYELEAFEPCPPRRKLLFLAKDVPPLGYRTFYLTRPAEVKTASQAGDVGRCENDFYRVALAPGGIKSIYDKEQHRELLKPGRFLGGEVFTMLSVAATDRGRGTDAGEFGAVPLPVMDGSFDRVATHHPAWRLIESGPLRSVRQLEQPMGDTTVRQRFVMWNVLKRLDCEVDLLDFNGKLWREFRMALPLAMDQPQLAYEVPFGVVRVGKDEIPMTGGHAYGDLNYDQLCRDIHPRLVQDFVDASDERGGVTMSSSVSAFDWVDPTTNATDALLQPLLLASRKSCNGEGVWYPQAGDHHYRFTLATHPGDWHRGWRDGIGANHPLLPVTGVTPGEEANLPEAKSFFSVSEPNVVLSSIKKCEDDDSLIVRLYDIEGRDSQPALKCFLPVRSARHTDIIEEPGTDIRWSGNEVRLPVGHNAIETVKLDLGIR